MIDSMISCTCCRIIHISSSPAFLSSQVSFILHPASFNIQRSSFIPHHSSFILHNSSFIIHNSSSLIHPSSFIIRPTQSPQFTHSCKWYLQYKWGSSVAIIMRYSTLVVHLYPHSPIYLRGIHLINGLSASKSSYITSDVHHSPLIIS